MTIRVLDIKPDPSDRVFAVLVTLKKDTCVEGKLFGPFFDDGTAEDFVREEVKAHPDYGTKVVRTEIFLVHPTFVKRV